MSRKRSPRTVARAFLDLALSPAIARRGHVAPALDRLAAIAALRDLLARMERLALEELGQVINTRGGGEA